MTNLKFKILSLLYDAPRSTYENDLLNQFPNEILQAQAALGDLEEDNLIEYDINHVRCTITKPGRAALEMFQEVRNKETENKRAQASQRKLQITQMLVAPIIFIVGLIVEHFGSIIDWFLSLFH